MKNGIFSLHATLKSVKPLCGLIELSLNSSYTFFSRGKCRGVAELTQFFILNNNKILEILEKERKEGHKASNVIPNILSQ